ncbi:MULTISPECIES: M16 family metallopeptidase [unclassified Parabacteroides]|uniref:M16 family metallopeptidase n=1 Tax=unclassified Parabacteroides TaxID=2649774 RepID=UPI002475973F|nr:MULTISPECIES: M16 family metallopeptidase [unclassified Parabacteroides]
MLTSTLLLNAQTPESLQVKEYTLQNGLTVWLNEDHSQPKVFGAVLVKAGAKDSPDTGIPHYFEHIMFKGTEKIGTLNYAEEKLLLDSIEVKYETLARTTDPAERAQIQQEINALSVKAAEYVVPNEFDRLITRYGGSGLNAGTSYDYTVYFNTFSPQYFAQWAEINSERLLSPVFRLFQSELETVYEEKNMYSDMMGSQAIERLTERYFRPHPYAYPILGNTENLKNPSLKEMRKFFETYYVASNMGLILSGDFDAEEVMPILEKTFSRIRPGNIPQKEPVELPDFNGKESVEIKFPVPVVKAVGLGFRGVPANHSDQVALNIAVGLLNNSNGTGFLDKLMVDGQVLSTMALNESMNEAGILGVIVIPKLLFQSNKKAEKLVWEAIDKIKNGDFSEETFQSLKLEQKREYISSLEDINSRAQMMMRIYSQGKSWHDYMESLTAIDQLTREDISAIARKYFSENHLHVTKKTGKYPKEYLPKPKFAPVTPPHRDSSSVYARELEKLPVKEIQPRFIDFENDVEQIKLQEQATLFATANPVNNIFTLNLSYGVGTLERPVLPYLASYLNYIGTEQKTFNEFRERLQVLGSTLSYEATDHDFIVKVTGFDDHFKETVTMVSEFLTSPKADEKKIKQVIDEAKIMEKGFVKSNENLAKALLEKVKYGEHSRYLKKLPLSEVKKLKGADLLKEFASVQQVACHFHYTGTLAATEVADVLKATMPLTMQTASQSPIYRESLAYDKPTVFFLNMPDLSQSIIYGYTKGDQITDMHLRHASRLFAGYFGGDMSSIMFQEIREFRSFAYRVSASYVVPPFKQAGQPGEFLTLLSTQGDKTLDALTVLDELIKNMPERPERLDAFKQTLNNYISNDYPSFRRISSKLASYLREGYKEDPNKAYLADIQQMQMDDIIRFYELNVKDNPMVYMIVGNSKHIDMKRLAQFGTIVELKKKDIYR